MKSLRQAFDTQCWSIDDDSATQNFPAWDYVLKAIKTASLCQINCDNEFVNAFPGDHYRILAGLITHLDRSSGPLTLVDIGTHYGTSARTMLDFSEENDQVITYDVAPIENYCTRYITEHDFNTRLTQHVVNIVEPESWLAHKEILINADFIMCDGPKDGVFEASFFELLASTELTKKPRWLFLDDIRFPSEMIYWRLIDSPKVDLTSVGHFSGTGLVDISEGLKLSR